MPVGAVLIKNIEFDLASRHELIPLLMVLKHFYVNCQDKLERIFVLVRNDIYKKNLHKSGCTGMSYWETFFISALRLGCNLDFDQLSYLTLNHIILRQTLGIEPS